MAAEWVEAFIAAVGGAGGNPGGGVSLGPLKQDPPGSGLYVPDTSQTED